MRGRKKLTDPPVEWKIHIPKSIADAIEQQLYDPLMDKAAYGSRSKLTIQLYIEWLAKQPQPSEPVDMSDLAR